MNTQATQLSTSIDPYQVIGSDQIFSPGLVIFRDLLEHNLDETVRIAGSPQVLRPHVKTHKTREIVRMWMERGVSRHKCATIAEAEMLASEGVADILLAYQIVGPNLGRWQKLVAKFPRTRFTSLVDHPLAAEQLAKTAADGHFTAHVMLDLNSGMDRTGIAPGPEAIELYEMICGTTQLSPEGLHWYDGQHRQADFEERRAAVLAGWSQFLSFRDTLLMAGLPVPRVVAAGSGSFAILAATGEPNLELSPGTTVYFDADLAERFPELPFRPALGILTRVVSCRQGNRLTFDVGHKSCAADQPAGRRLWFPQLPDAVEVQHTEEHLVIESRYAPAFDLGSVTVAIPRHACPASAVYQAAYVVSAGRLSDRWEIAARDRVLSI